MSNPKFIDSPVFIVGHPKSGTSLLYSLLDNHPEMVVLPEETNFYFTVTPYLKLIKLLPFSKKFKVNFVLESLLAGTFGNLRNPKESKTSLDGSRDYSSLDYQTFEDGFKSYLIDCKLTVQNIFSAISFAYHFASKDVLSYSNPKVWVEKTPQNSNFIKPILTSFENAKMVFVVRDPRDNYVSYKTYSDKFKNSGSSLSAEHFSRNWNKVADVYLKYKNNKNVHLIRYEDLINNTTEVLSKLIDFIGVGMSPTLTQPSKFGVKWKGNSSFGDINESISSKALSRFESYEPQSEISQITSFCSNGLYSFEYLSHSVNTSETIIKEKQNVFILFYQLNLDRVQGVLRVLKRFFIIFGRSIIKR